MAELDINKTLILGIGNILLRDEGLGVRAVDLFKERYTVPRGVACFDGGTLGLKLLSTVEEYRRIIIIDALSTGKPPGTIHRFTGEEIKVMKLPHRASAHEVGLKDLLTIAFFEGFSPEVVLLGAVPLDISPGLELSPLIKGKLPAIADMVRKELENFGIKPKKRCVNA